MNTVRKLKWSEDPDYEVYQITSRKFCAGLTFYQGTVIEAAPILRGYLGWTFDQVKMSCAKLYWKIEKIR